MEPSFRIFIFFLVTFISFDSLSAEIMTASTFAEVEKAFSAAGTDTLGVFDIDDVLTYPSEPAFQRGNWRSNQQFVKCLLKAMTPDQRWLFANYSLVQSDSLPVDSEAWSVIRKIQQRGVKTLALTGSMPGLLGDIYLPEWRYRQLHRLGIDFSASFPCVDSFCMNDLCCYLGRYPTYYKGILFANGEQKLKVDNCNKAEVLTEFFRRAGWRPRRVIAVDDSMENLQAIEKVLSYYDPSIRFLGIHFTGSPSVGIICGDEFQSRWNHVFSLVRKHECQQPSCLLCP